MIGLKGRNRRLAEWPTYVVASLFASLVTSILVYLSPGRIGLAVVAGVLVVTLVLFLRGHSAGGVDAFEPMTIFLLSFSLLFIFRPLYARSRNAFELGFLTTDLPGTYSKAIWIGVVGALAFGIAYQIRVGANVARRFRPMRPPDSVGIGLLVNHFIVATSMLGFYVFLHAQGGIGYLRTLLSGRNAHIAQTLVDSNGYLYGAPALVSGVALWVFCLGLQTGRKRFIALGLIESAYSVVLALGAGSRSYLLPALLSLIMAYYFMASRRPRLRNIAIFALVIYMFGITLPRIARDESNNKYGARHVLSEAFDVRRSLDDFGLGQDTAMVDAFAIEIDVVPSRYPFALGSTYIEALSRPVPRKLWAGKPVSADQVLNEVLFPDTYHAGLGVAFSIFGEPWLNAGWPGVIIILALFGAACRGLWEWFSAQRPNCNNVAVTALCIPMVFVFMRGGFGVDYQRLVFPLLPLLALIRITTRRVS